MLTTFVMPCFKRVGGTSTGFCVDNPVDVTGASTTEVYQVFTGLMDTSVSFMMWLVQVSWPFLLAIAFIYLMWRLAHKFTGFGKKI